MACIVRSWLLAVIALMGLIVAARPAAAGRDVDVEQARLRQHFTTVLGELRAADVRGLTNAQRERRASLIDELVRYRERGVFPRNLDFDERTPYFIDDRGVRCAMAHLIETHGGAALVAHVAATANNAYVRELAADTRVGPQLAVWLEHNGLETGSADHLRTCFPKTEDGGCSVSVTGSSARPAYLIGLLAMMLFARRRS